MFRCAVEIQGSKRSFSEMATLDTGYDGGILLDRKLAKALGVTLVKGRIPIDLYGVDIPGKSTSLLVTLVNSGLEAIETPCFCPDEEVGEILLGAYWMAQTKATLTIGDLKFRAAKVNPAADIRDFDWSKVKIRWGHP